MCLYDGFAIVSNVHTIRAFGPHKINPNETTEDWTFAENDVRAKIDQQPQILVRTNRTDSGQRLQLLFELSQLCQSTVTDEKCEVGSGWATIPLDGEKQPLVTDTKSYNELFHGGRTDETNVLLDPQYLRLHTNRISGASNQLKLAQKKFFR